MSTPSTNKKKAINPKSIPVRLENTIINGIPGCHRGKKETFRMEIVWKHRNDPVARDEAWTKVAKILTPYILQAVKEKRLSDAQKLMNGGESKIRC